MSLEKQMIEIPFAAGIDTDTDPKKMNGGLTKLVNGTVRSTGRLSKRYGSNTINYSFGMVAASAVTTFGNELLQQSGNKLYSYSPAQDKWSDRGLCYSTAVLSRQITRKSVGQTQADSVAAYGFELHGWVETDGTVRYSLIDSATKTFIVSDALSYPGLPNSKNVRCSAAAGFLYLFWAFGNFIYCLRINPVSGESSLLAPVNDLGTAGIYDVLVHRNSRFYISYARASDFRVVVCGLDLSPTYILAPITIAETVTHLVISNSEGAAATQDRLCLAWFVAATGTRSVVYDDDLVVTGSVQTVDSNTGAINSIGLVGDGSNFSIFVEKTNASTMRHFIRSVVIAQDGSFIKTADVFLRSVGIAGRPFVCVEKNVILLPVVHSSPLQATYFVVDVNGTVVSKHQPGTAGGIVASNMLPNISRNGSVYSWSMINKTQLVSRDGNLYSLTGVSHTSLDFSDNSSFSSVEIGGNLHIVGGCLGMYDGISVVEHGFHLFPESLSSATAAGSILAGTYLFCALYEWMDGKGQIHRSAPSVPLTVTLGGASQVTATIPTLRITSKRSPRANAWVVLYRTAASQTGVFYRVGSIVNNPAADSVNIVDNAADTSIFANEIMYTSGGVLENMPAPACRYIALWQNRIFLAGLEDDSSFAFSKAWSAGGPVEFAGEFTGGIDAEGGPVVGIAALEDKFIFLKRDRFAMTYGEGPNDLGSGSFYPRPQLIASDTGCVDQQSIARVPQGLVFKSAKSFMLLQSNLSAQPIGYEVKAFMENNVTSAVLLPDDNQIRFVHSDGPCLVYDYILNQWSTYDNYSGIDATIWKNQFVLLGQSGVISVEDKTVFRDSGKAIKLAAETSWINLSGIAGYQRVYRVSLVGEYVSPHLLRIKVGYDYENSWSSEIIFNTVTQLDTRTYGEDLTYGSAEIYGGNGNAYVFESHLSIQKCQAIRFLIEDLSESSTMGSGEALNLTSLSLQVGIKRGFGKKSYIKYSSASE